MPRLPRSANQLATGAGQGIGYRRFGLFARGALAIPSTPKRVVHEKTYWMDAALITPTKYTTAEIPGKAYRLPPVNGCLPALGDRWQGSPSFGKIETWQDWTSLCLLG